MLFLVVVRFGNDYDFLSNQESWIESHTELTNKVDFSFLQGWQITDCISSSDGSQIFNQFSSAHTDTCISELNVFFFIIDFDSNFKIASIA